ncbi:hypothetical protein OR16_26943 [Cupriavidus basilensis OR16]|uniref:Uncharacterized protein n=1 Tax=Cupriavidus basilensis OR16 TaxID=1127483 RepID=H1SB50_9BURK|nr:hypothetical protein [Cupriavidus basilensis]EHP40288.1 hypothetical protein OR16_26943 [Cupriavidus basilensis OR16]
MYRHAHSLAVIYSLDTVDAWLFAVITGPRVIHFGPFESREDADEILAEMYPDTPAVELPAQPARLDSEGVTILGYAAAQQAVMFEESGE